jgi:hypothetical protein
MVTHHQMKGERIVRHETDTRQVPGWWANLLHATCSCGWHGPTRDMNQWPRAKYLLERDADEHRETVYH